MEVEEWIPALMGFLFGVIANNYFSSKREISYDVKYGAELANDFKDEGLEIKLDGIEVDSISVSKVVIFNSGNEFFDKGDIISSLKLNTDYGKIYKVAQYKISEGILDLEAGDVISFSYFENGAGVILKVFHDYSENQSIRLSGRLKGVSSITKRRFQSPKNTIESILPYSRFYKKHLSKVDYGHLALISKAFNFLVPLIAFVSLLLIGNTAIVKSGNDSASIFLRGVILIGSILFAFASAVEGLAILKGRAYVLPGELKEFYDE